MKLQLHTGFKDVEVTTITLIEDTTGYKMWNCPTCKNPVFQYRGRVVKMVPGESPVELPIILQCRNCQQKYLLKTIVGRE